MVILMIIAGFSRAHISTYVFNGDFGNGNDGLIYFLSTHLKKNCFTVNKKKPSMSNSMRFFLCAYVSNLKLNVLFIQINCFIFT